MFWAGHRLPTTLACQTSSGTQLAFAKPARPYYLAPMNIVLFDAIHEFDLLLTDRLTLDGDDGYVIDGKVKKFDTHIETIKVLQPGGMHREEQLEIRRSVHGPVVITPQLNMFDLFYVALDPREFQYLPRG